MKRTITLKKYRVQHRKKFYSDLCPTVRRMFGLECDQRYRIEIVEGTKFQFKTSANDFLFYHIFDIPDNYCSVCKEQFHALFFRPNLSKKYNITVKKI